MTKVHIDLRDAYLSYPIGPHLRDSLKTSIFRAFGHSERLPTQVDYVDALKGVSVRVDEGERIGIIGRNGSGKSTILRVMAGVYPLRAGTRDVHGRIQSMFEIGLGFEPEHTGRENILFRGLVMGVEPKLIRAREDEIIAFADIGEFIDMPMRTYSSGMTVRLAFAISSYLNGEILLIDEIFGAGDAAFAQKAVARMEELVAQAGIVVIATHDTGLVKRLCSRCIWLEKGKILQEGDPAEVADAYLNRVSFIAA